MAYLGYGQFNEDEEDSQPYYSLYYRHLRTHPYYLPQNPLSPLVRDVQFDSSWGAKSSNSSWLSTFWSSIVMAVGSVAVMIGALLILSPANAYLVIIMSTLGLIVVGLVTAAKRLDLQSVSHG